MSTHALAYRCPHCRQVVEVDESVIGETVTCPNEECRRPFEVRPPDATLVSESDLRNEDVKSLQRERLQEVHDNDVGSAAEETLEVVHPSMFRASPFKFSGLVALAGLGLAGLILALFAGELELGSTVWLSGTPLWYVSLAILLVAAIWLGGWWLKTRFITLKVTSVRSLLRRGIISKDTTEVRHRDVRNLQVEQNIFQRIVNVGDIAVSSSGQDDLEIVVKGVPNPERIADRIREMQ